MIIIWHRGSTLWYPGELYECSKDVQRIFNKIRRDFSAYFVWRSESWRSEILSKFSYGASFSIKVFMWCYDFANIFGNACSPVVARSPTIHKSIGMINTPGPECAPIEFRYFEISECWSKLKHFGTECLFHINYPSVIFIFTPRKIHTTWRWINKPCRAHCRLFCPFHEAWHRAPSSKNDRIWHFATYKSSIFIVESYLTSATFPI